MFDDIEAIFYNQLVLKYDSYRTLRKSRVVGNDQLIIAATECATALFHFREHIPNADRKTRSQVVSECQDYRLVADVCNASKHSSLTRPTSEGPPLVQSAQDIYELLITTRFQDAKGDYTDSEALVNVKCSDGVTRCLDDALVGTLNYWGNELQRLGIRNFSPFEKQLYPGTHFVSREDALSASFVVTQGQRFQSRQQILIFDDAVGYAKPMDLTGSKVGMSIYEPIRSIDITATPPGGGEGVSFSINLNDEQSLRFLRLDSDADRNIFLEEIAVEEQEQISVKFVEALNLKSA